jgi:RND family efflux transporter MFP subunit
MQPTGIGGRPRRAIDASSLAVLAALLLAPACDRARPAQAGESEPPAPPREVRTALAEEQEWEPTLHVIGQLVEQQRATLGAKVPGRLAELRADLGSAVGQGEVVARVDPSDYELRVTQAEAALGRARARLGLSERGDDDSVQPEETAGVRHARALLDQAQLAFERVTGLRAKAIASQAELDEAEAALRVAQAGYQEALQNLEEWRAELAESRAALALARSALADTEIAAPFDGLLLERLAAPGDYLSTGASVATLIQVDPLRLRAEVPERDAPRVRAGLELRARLDGEDRALSVRVARVAPAIAPRSRMLTLEADVPNPEGALRAGAFARVEIVLQPLERALAIPEEALVSFAGVDKVFVVEGGVARERPIATGRRGGGRVEVLSGLTAGERVVVAPGDLRSEQAVREAPPEPP